MSPTQRHRVGNSEVRCDKGYTGVSDDTHDKFVSTSFKLGISPDNQNNAHDSAPFVENHQVQVWMIPTFDYLAKNASVSQCRAGRSEQVPISYDLI
jgi:hypothetical protein